MEFVSAHLYLKARQPLHKEFLRARTEPEARRIFAFQTEQLAEDLCGLLLRSRIRRPVHIVPVRRRVRPHEQLKPLNQSVIARPVFESIDEIRAKPARLDAAQ